MNDNQKKMGRMINLLDIQRKLAYVGYNTLHLEYLEILRFEIQEEIEKLKEKPNETKV